MQLLIGCPVRRREWVLPSWFACVRAALGEAGITNYGFIFVVDPHDKETLHVITSNVTDEHPVFVTVVDEPAREDIRVWNFARYQHMAFIRNRLLELVREQQPDFFWSVDSDMLVSRRCLAGALELTDRFDAVGSKAYLTPHGTSAPNYAHLGREMQLIRPDQDIFFRTDVIMAIKLMNPSAYAVDYAAHSHGEDIGWALAARDAGVRLGWDGRFRSMHMMEKPSGVAF